MLPLATVVVTSSSIAPAQLSALRSLYEATDGAHWQNNTRWLGSDSACSWHGVGCDANKSNVLAVDLRHNTMPWGADGHIRVTGRCVQRWVQDGRQAQRAFSSAPQAKILRILWLKTPFSYQNCECSTILRLLIVTHYGDTSKGRRVHEHEESEFSWQ